MTLSAHLHAAALRWTLDRPGCALLLGVGSWTVVAVAVAWALMDALGRALGWWP